MKIGIVIPCYNGEIYLAEAIRSATGALTEQDALVVVDDGSTDSTAAKVLEVAETDSRIRLVRQENKGLSEARNT
ncbi:MAG: glycosyltransferase, partial [Fimbriimonadales bacterium]|nr:glycosyltransferase [Fimbriimonadales bacterium]